MAEPASPPSCDRLIATIDADISRLTRMLKSYEKDGPPIDDTGVIDYLPFDFLSNAEDERLECHAFLRGRPAGPALRAAVTRASRFALAFQAANRWNGKGPLSFGGVDDAFEVERATGIEGPISQVLRRRGLAAYRDYGEESFGTSFDGRSYSKLENPWNLAWALRELAALCLAHPSGFHQLAVKLGYPEALLQPRPSRLLTNRTVDLGDEAYASSAVWPDYLDAERDRIVSECPG